MLLLSCPVCEMTKCQKELRGMQALSGRARHIRTSAAFYLLAFGKGFINSCQKLWGSETRLGLKQLIEAYRQLPMGVFVCPVKKHFVGSEGDRSWHRYLSVRSQPSGAHFVGIGVGTSRESQQPQRAAS